MRWLLSMFGIVFALAAAAQPLTIDAKHLSDQELFDFSFMQKRQCNDLLPDQEAAQACILRIACRTTSILLARRSHLLAPDAKMPASCKRT